MRRALGAVVLLSGCVYYNGVYNAKRLTRSAEKADRDGRTIEATNYWSQVIVKADSVVARHPASEYVPQVELLRGRAMARLGQCPEAIPVLEAALPFAPDSAALETATFELARCYAAGGNIAAAADAFGRLANARTLETRREARFQYAHALRMAGRFPEALDALARVDDPRAPSERMVALAGAGQLDSAWVMADSAVARADTSAPWDSLLSVAGRRDPAAASAMVDRLLQMPGVPLAEQARWLAADGVRLMALDSARGDARLGQAGAVGGASEPAGAARLLRVKLALGRVVAAADLAPVLDTLAALRDVTRAAFEAVPLYDAAVRVRAAADSAAIKAPEADMALFLAAEAARDGLHSARLAAALFHRIVDQWPASPYAPKALLALHDVRPADVPDLGGELAARYPASPYYAALRGESDPRLQSLEDSLSAFATSRAMERAQPAASPATPSQPGVRRPGTQTPNELR